MKSLTSRTTLITAVAVAGVLIAGTAAIAANIGILNASNDSSIGSLSATDDLVPSTTLGAGIPMVVEIATPAPTPEADGASYSVDEAGTVSVTTTGGALTLVDAADNEGWTHTATQPDSVSLRVEFVNDTRTVVFTATLDANGRIVADVTEPVIVAGATPSTIATSQSGADDQYESDDDDDRYEYEDDEHEDEYEGADDDD